MVNRPRMQEQEKKTDIVEIMIGRTLRIGITFSSVLIICGLLLFFVTGDTGYAKNDYPTHVQDILLGFISFRPYGVTLTGLLLLMLTPVFRVGVSIIAFLLKKDYLYTLITLIVFSILIISFTIGKAG
ncbi:MULTISPECIES: DUF1634 domain-containing protein [unclassified Sporolactobacillus]|uniref:DUF1634 domain-containing protein n=1 Tax=unclassified Sporolactobacillus TaxID=2628533 RepID=UPI002367DAC6|nr:DUF1634 domain-containing protein [Sporolactobacillus sp. CQH2019]MDD9150252.1 DUF1634 domain-containing protein [Sporolactobacillus sp. CQH2019]